MSILYVNTGSSANKGDGDSLRVAFTKINHDFDEVLGIISTCTTNLSQPVIPSADLIYNLGAPDLEWNTLYTGQSIYMAGNELTVTATGILINGEPISNGSGIGSIGYTGSVGGQGPQGIIGYTGSIGNLGVQGPQGYTGSVGPYGYTGSIGDIGPQGPQGVQGVIGYTGSAYIPVPDNTPVISVEFFNYINTNTALLSYTGTTTSTLAMIMAVNDSSTPYVVSTNNATNTWTFSAQGSLTVPTYDYTRKSISGTIETVYGDPYSSYGEASASEVTVYTASSEEIVGLKMTLRIQYQGHLEMVEISAVKPFDNSIVDYLVYGSVKSDSTATETTIAVNLDSNNFLRVQAQPPFDAYFTYSVTEYHKTEDITVRG